MGRQEEFAGRKKARATRKRMRQMNEGGEQDTAAAKRRRRKAKRRVTESMCYALPTPEDPFLDSVTHNKMQLTEDAPYDEPKPQSNGKAKKSPSRQPPKSEEETEPNVKKVFWPSGSQGTSPLESIEDPRLPGVFRLAAYALLGKGQSTTKLQRESWQGVLRGRDLLAVGGEPKGFIMGYLLPATAHVAAQGQVGEGEGPVVVVVVPNRETGAEVLNACRQLRSIGLSMRAVNLHDAAPLEKQRDGLASQAAELVTCTSQRLTALLEAKALPLGRASFLVVHGASTFLQNGAESALQELLKAVLPQRQALLFIEKATPELHSFARSWLQDPIARAVEDKEISSTCACIVQNVVVCAEDKKHQKVVSFVTDIREAERSTRAKSRILVYACRPDKVIEAGDILSLSLLRFTRIVLLTWQAGPRRVAVSAHVADGADRASLELLTQPKHSPAADALLEAGHKATALHPRQPEEDQQQTEEDFRTGKVPIVVTNDIFRPGLRASTVPILVHVDIPPAVGQYARHVAAVARSSVRGQVLTLITKNEAIRAAELEEVLQQCEQPVDSKLAMFAKAVRVVQQQRHRETEVNDETMTNLAKAGVEAETQANGSRSKQGAPVAKPSSESEGSEDYESEEDDETTLLEEEMLGDSGVSAADEIAMLEAEKDLPLEDLVAKYREEAASELASSRQNSKGAEKSRPQAFPNSRTKNKKNK